MAWTAPTDRITGDIVTAAQWNALLGATGDMSLTATGIVTTQGDTVYATAANTLARLAKGTAYQALAMNAGATAPSWQASPTSVLTTTGDLLYASGANTLARLAAGTSGYLLQSSGAGSAPAWASVSSGWSLVGSNTTEQSTASGTASDLVTISGLSIAADSPIMILVNYRKTATGVQVSIGLKLNSTVIREASNASSTGIGMTSSASEVQDGWSVVNIGPRSTNYLRGLTLISVASGATGINVQSLGAAVNTNQIPNATITSVIIRGVSDGPATLYVKDVRVYTGAS